MVSRVLFYILALVFIYAVQFAAGKIEQGPRFGECPPGPFWLIATVSAIVIALVSERFVFKRRVGPPRRHTHCRRCGYDLRVTPDRCPECGLGSIYVTSDGFQRDEEAYSGKPPLGP
jgi:ribosomal protein L37E